MIQHKIRNGVDSMKSPGIYEGKTNSSRVKATIKIGKHTVPNNKFNMAIHNFRTTKKKKKEKKINRAGKISKKFSEGMSALENKQKTRKISVVCYGVSPSFAWKWHLIENQPL